MAAPSVTLDKVLTLLEGQLEAGSVIGRIPFAFNDVVQQNGLKWLATCFSEMTESNCTLVLDRPNKQWRLVPRGRNAPHSSLDSGNEKSPNVNNGGETEDRKKIPRPPNAFILYRQHHHPILKSEQPELHNNEISKIIGSRWRSEPNSVKASWKRKADEAKVQHMTKHPDYTYQPRKPGEKKRRLTKYRRALIEEAQKQPLALTDEVVANVRYEAPDKNETAIPEVVDFMFPPRQPTGNRVPWSFLPNDGGYLTYDIDADFDEEGLQDAVIGQNSLPGIAGLQAPTSTTQTELDSATLFDIGRSEDSIKDSDRNDVMLEFGTTTDAYGNQTFGRIIGPDVVPGEIPNNVSPLEVARAMFEMNFPNTF